MPSDSPRPILCALFLDADHQILLTNSGEGHGLPMAPIQEGQAAETVLVVLARTATGGSVKESRFLGVVDRLKPAQAVLLCFAARLDGTGDGGLGTEWKRLDDARTAPLNRTTQEVLRTFPDPIL